MPSVWVLYNAVNPRDKDSIDWISEAAVQNEAEAVQLHLHALGQPCRQYPVSSIQLLLRDLDPPPDLIVNLCEGFQGNAKKEMHIAALLELLGVPFTGNRAKTLAISQDKDLTKRLLLSEGIPTAPWIVYRGEPILGALDLRFPLLVKPAQEDASLGIGTENVVRDPRSLGEGVKKLFERYNQPILIEEFLPGREFSVSLLEIQGEVRTLPISEISLENLGLDAVVSYEAKWIEGSPAYALSPSLCPASLPYALAEKLQRLAKKTFSLLEGKDYGRVDFRMDRDGNPCVLEYNPNPDISLQAGFVKALKAANITYEDFLTILMNNNLSSSEHSHDKSPH